MFIRVHPWFNSSFKSAFAPPTLSRRTPRRCMRHGTRGAALVIVLAFVVLLTGLVVAYFSKAVSNSQLSSNSFNQSKTD
ncbi:MAG: hypothetical protein PHD76_15045, partial [Methylacidiphilales bacterium]|nr:hypothetical protein [Candidatus Methylacidiphilales bacterium]